MNEPFKVLDRYGVVSHYATLDQAIRSLRRAWFSRQDDRYFRVIDGTGRLAAVVDCGSVDK